MICSYRSMEMVIDWTTSQGRLSESSDCDWRSYVTTGCRRSVVNGGWRLTMGVLIAEGRAVRDCESGVFIL
ncbi:hypothetical protein L1049_008215 [Liquidambar formosana]|uniref:Uncharacterized protein n=1 Tax=Liquidambar formosana TaxID=63359 RepID=A0AAP0X4F2_LIQFO